MELRSTASTASTVPSTSLRLFALAVAALLALSACATTEAEATPTHGDFKPLQPTTATLAWSLDLTPVSGVLALDGAFAFYTIIDGELSIRVHSSEDGSLLWHHAAAPGGVLPSESEIRPLWASLEDENATEDETEDGDGSKDGDEDEDKAAIVYVAPPKEGAKQAFDMRNKLVAADPATGKVVSHSKPLSLAASPKYCDIGDGICVDAWMGKDNKRTTLRFDPQTGKVSKTKFEVSGTADSSGVGARVSKDDTHVVRVKDGKELWNRSLREEFTDQELSHVQGRSNRDENWTFMTIRPGKTHQVGDPAISYPLKNNIAALLNLETGKTIWRGKGYVPCPDEVISVAVRCRASGKLKIAREGEESYQNLKVTLEGLDSETGETTWELPLGDDPTVLDDEAPYSLGKKVVLSTKDGVKELDPAAGELSDIAPGVYLCHEEPKFELSLPWYAGFDDEKEWHGSQRFTICDESGEPVEGTPSVEAVQTTGAESAHLWIVPTEKGVLAYRLR